MNFTSSSRGGGKMVEWGIFRSHAHTHRATGDDFVSTTLANFYYVITEEPWEKIGKLINENHELRCLRFNKQK